MAENDKELFGEILGRTPDCIPLEILPNVESSNDFASYRPHLERCAYCKHELALFRSFEDSIATRAEAPEITWIVSELRRRPIAPAVQPTPKGHSWWPRLMGSIPAPFPKWLPAAGAAAVVLAIASGIFLSRQDHRIPSAPESGEYVWRSDAIQLAAPAGDLSAAPRTFEWRAIGGVRSYRFRLLEVDRTELWAGETTASHIDLPPRIAGRLTPGRTFLWQVSATTANGATVQSNLQPFHISRNTR